jgi:hypothetical protein
MLLPLDFFFFRDELLWRSRTQASRSDRSIVAVGLPAHGTRIEATRRVATEGFSQSPAAASTRLRQRRFMYSVDHHAFLSCLSCLSWMK